MSEHYKMCAEEYKGKNEGEWGYLYEYAYRTFDYLAVKTYIAERLYTAYKAGDKATLKELCEVYFPLLKEKTVAVHKVHRDTWFRNNKVLGWQNLDTRYAGMAARCDTAIMLIEGYLNGEFDKVEELEEERLPKGLSGFIHYSNINTVNIKI